MKIWNSKKRSSCNSTATNLAVAADNYNYEHHLVTTKETIIVTMMVSFVTVLRYSSVMTIVLMASP